MVDSRRSRLVGDLALDTAPQALVPAGRVVVGASRLDAAVAEAEHLLLDLLALLGSPVDAVGCTHLVSAPWRHEAVSLEVAGPVAVGEFASAVSGEVGVVVLGADGVLASAGLEDRRAGAAEAARTHASRSGGRAVVFPGSAQLVGEVSVAEVLSDTAVEDVLSTGEYAPNAVVLTGGYVRPEYVNGRLVLRAQHADPTRLRPWLAPETHCCGGH